MIPFMGPVLIYLYSFVKNNFNNQQLANGIAPDDAGLVELEKMFGTNKKTDEKIWSGCNTGLYIDSIDKWQDCSFKCKSYDYEYNFIKDSDNIHIGGKKLYGAYCLPKSINKCNLNTSILTLGPNGYKCVSKFPSLLGGPSGNEIVGCKSRILIDHATGDRYINFVPYNLIFNDVNELINGNFRFECEMDEMHMTLPQSIASRFESELNVCGVMNDGVGRLDFEKGICHCENYVGSNKNELCTKCTSGWTVETPNNAHGTKYAYTIGKNCVNPDTAPADISTYVFRACGHQTMQQAVAAEEESIVLNSRSTTAIDKLDATNGGVTAASYETHCERGLLYITNTYTPAALENMFDTSLNKSFGI